MNSVDSLQGWVPLYLKHGIVNWGYMGERRFVEPFSEDTLQKLATRPFNRLFRQQTSLDELLERGVTHPGLPLKGLVFHVGRCGSTLIAQALSGLSDSVVLSEPVIFDSLLQAIITDPHLPEQQACALLKAMLAAQGQARRPNDQRLFVKTDAWHIIHIRQILAAFPGVPWLFLYRDPIEVLVSHARMPGILVVPGSLLAHGLSAPPEQLIKPLEHGAWILGQILQAAAQAFQDSPGGLLLNYRELPTAIENRINQHFDLRLDDQDLEQVRAFYQPHAKNPQHAFEDDCADKQASADANLLAMVERWMRVPYQQLERLRQTSS